MAGKQNTRFLMGILVLCIGAAMMIGSVLLHRSDTAFFAAATQTSASVVRMHRVSRVHKRDRMSVLYAFTVDGQIIEASESWNGTTAEFAALSVGDEIRIAYIPDEDPTRIRSRLVTGGRQEFMTSILLIGGLLAAVGGVLTATTRRSG